MKPWMRCLFVVGLCSAMGMAMVAEAVERKMRAIRPGIVSTMPGKSYTGKLPKLDAEQQKLRDALKADVQMLGGTIGERHVSGRHTKLDQARRYLQRGFVSAGYKVDVQSYEARGRAVHNLAVELPGTTKAKEIVIVGAHYDSAVGAPGANDNGSGMAGVMALARAFAGKQHARTLRFVAFTNEEQPHFQTSQMGSLVYARRCKARGEKIVGMISLETMGYFSNQRGSQRYPSLLAPLYPSRGNFIGFVGDTGSTNLLTRAVKSFRTVGKIPSEGGALPAGLPGVGWSDHWSFWQVGYPAIMVTDTALFRYPHYHTRNDTPDKVDYTRMALVVQGLEAVVRDLVK